MMPRRCALILVSTCLFLAVLVAVWPPPTTAQTDGAPALVPYTVRGFVELSSLSIRATRSCEGQGCAWEVEHRYTLTNRDRIKPTELQVRLAPATSADVAITEASFYDGPAGQPLGPDTWSLRLPASSSTRFRVRYTAPLSDTHFHRWQWDPTRVNAWGPITSARIELDVGTAVSDDLILEQLPRADGFDGQTLYWEYEGPPASESHEVWLLSPQTYDQLQSLGTQGEYRALAQLLGELRHTAAAQGAPYPDPFHRIVAALRAATESGNAAEAYQELAEAYLARAEAYPNMEANYRLLAVKALESGVAAGLSDPLVSRQLADLYYSMAQQARQAGDPAGALALIQRAAEYAPPDPDSDLATVEEMTLDWAVDLASKGRVTEALEQASDILSPRVHDALFRYAPPVVAAHTQVTLTAQSRVVSYQLYLYPPLSEHTFVRIEALTQQLGGLSRVEASLGPIQQQGSPQALLRVTVQHRGVDDLAVASEQIGRLAAAEPDMVEALILAPWIETASAFHVLRTPWLDRYVYQEKPSLGPLYEVQDYQAEYTTWRLVEAASAAPDNALERLEHQLTALALREQRQFWDNLASSSYWSYHVSFEEPSDLPTMHWLLGWGQDRTLSLSHHHFQWRAIGMTISVFGAAVLLMGIIIGTVRRWQRKRRAD